MARKTRADYEFTETSPMMEIAQLVRIFSDVSGLDENQAKTAIYYSMATHKLRRFDWFPALAFIGAPGTGKSKAIDIIERLCFRPLRITCHATMTAAALRDDMARARNKTALIEEADLYPNRKQLQSYLINRVDRMRTSGLPVKEQVETETGVREWRTHHRYMFGATVIHDRRSLDDMAAESRVIVINTIYKEGEYIEPPKSLSLPKFILGGIPEYFPRSGRALDTWKPLIMVASSVGDTDWLQWANQQIREATDELRDGQACEMW
jgi:hypothetical protein